MMRTRWTAFAIGWLTVATWSTDASGQPGWLKQAIAEAEGYTVDSKAPALVLRDVAEVKIDAGGRSTCRIEYAVKILKPAGIGESYLLESVGEHRKVKGLKGWRVDSNGKCHDLDKRRVGEFDVETSAGYYDKLRRLTAAFDGVGTGDVVGYEYTVEQKGDWESYYQSFTFQTGLPVVMTRYDITLPEGWEHRVSSQNIENISHTDSGYTLSWGYRDLPYRPEEPMMPSLDRVSRTIKFHCYDPQSDRAGHFPDWRTISQWGVENYEKVSEPDSQLAQKAAGLTESASSRWDKFCAVARYVRDDIRYVGVEIGEGRFVPRPCGETYAHKYGDCKDKSTLLCAMLKAAGVPSCPVLANVGETVDPDFPTPFAFNHVILAVPLDALGLEEEAVSAAHDGWLYFDPTVEAIPPGRLPAWLYGQRVLRLSPEDSALVRLPDVAADSLKRVYRATARLHDDNSLSFDAVVTDYGVRASTIGHQRSLQSQEETITDWRERFASTMRNPAISDVTMGSSEDSTWIAFHVEADNYLDFTGDYGLLKADFFHADEANELSSKERIYPVWFREGGTFETNIVWQLPQHWKASEIPAADSASCQTALMRFDAVTDSAGLKINTLVSFTGEIEQVDNYANARSFHGGLRAAYEARILLTQ